MPAPPVIDNDQLLLATYCLEFTKALVMQGVSFNFSITAGSFTFSFDTSNGNRNSATAQSPAGAGKTRKLPSKIRFDFLLDFLAIFKEVSYWDLGLKKGTIWPRWDPFYILFVAPKMPALRFRVARENLFF